MPSTPVLSPIIEIKIQGLRSPWLLSRAIPTFLPSERYYHSKLLLSGCTDVRLGVALSWVARSRILSSASTQGLLKQYGKTTPSP
jgi:hypothetical protein